MKPELKFYFNFLTIYTQGVDYTCNFNVSIIVYFLAIYTRSSSEECLSIIPEP